MAYQPINVADINAPLLASTGQYGPLPTAGVQVGGNVAVANSLLLGNYYVVGTGGPKANSTTNYLAQILGTTP